MTGFKNQAAFAARNCAAKRRAVNGATERAKRLLVKVTSLERQVVRAVARADYCNAMFINAHTGSVKRSVHNKLKRSANAALHKVIAETKEIEERNKRMEKALAYLSM